MSSSIKWSRNWWPTGLGKERIPSTHVKQVAYSLCIPCFVVFGRLLSACYFHGDAGGWYGGGLHYCSFFSAPMVPGIPVGKSQEDGRTSKGRGSKRVVHTNEKLRPVVVHVEGASCKPFYSFFSITQWYPSRPLVCLSLFSSLYYIRSVCMKTAET